MIAVNILLGLAIAWLILLISGTTNNDRHRRDMVNALWATVILTILLNAAM